MGSSTLPIKHFDLIVPLGVFLLLLLEFILLILVREGNLYVCYKSKENPRINWSSSSWKYFIFVVSFTTICQASVRCFVLSQHRHDNQCGIKLMIMKPLTLETMQKENTMNDAQKEIIVIRGVYNITGGVQY